ncbi:MAG: S-layer homology domain-containing protein [Lawsonibacter sp.]|nr:S-layer homology domain-containing protein [Lawsonibacter sp.]
MRQRRILSGALALCLSLAMLCTGAQAAGSTARQEAIQALGILTGSDSLSSPVTRAQLTQMLVAASPYQDSAEGYGASLFKDLKGDHWASGYVRIAVEQGWMSGFVDGTFRPDQTVTLEEGCTALLKLLGYDASALKGAYPAAQLSKARSIGLLDDVSASQGSSLTRQHCVDLFYNLLTVKNSSGTVYGTTLGYSVTNGQVDYSALVTADTKGPYVAESTSLSLPFSPDTIYYDGSLSALSAVKQFDVYYYNANMKTVWVYHNRVTGTLTGCSPSAAAPTAVTVAGGSYTLGTSEAAYQLSSQGSFQEGDMVTLLLGMNGEVVRAVAAQENEAVYYGTVVSSAKGASTSATTSSATTSAQVTTQVACTDGIVRTFYHTGGALSTGRLVSVSVTSAGTTLKGMAQKSLSGTVNAAGTKLGVHTLAANVEILDTDENGGYARIYPSRLAGCTLSAGDVRCYTLDANGAIDRLILREATGDTYTYTYLTRAESSTGEANLSGSYTYLVNGESRTLNTANQALSIRKGGAVLRYEDGQVSGFQQLESVSLTELTSLYALSGTKKYGISEEVQVLLADSSDGRSYYAASLEEINASQYTLTGWYDNLGCSAGGRIRIIIAVPK